MAAAEDLEWSNEYKADQSVDRGEGEKWASGGVFWKRG